MPVVVVALAGWVAKVALDVGRTSRQSRKDFLDAWGGLDRADDLAIEVAARHLVGRYLPAPLVRRALQRPDPSRTLLRLAALWEVVEFDAETGLLHASKPSYATTRRARVHQTLHFLGYAAACVVSYLFGKWAIAGTPSQLMTWLYALFAITSLGLSLASLARAEALGLLAREGFKLMDAMNRVAEPAASVPEPSLEVNHSPAAAASV